MTGPLIGLHISIYTSYTELPGDVLKESKESESAMLNVLIVMAGYTEGGTQVRESEEK